MFLARYNYKLCDKNGNVAGVKLPQLNYNSAAAERPHGQIYLQCVRVNQQ